MLLVICSLLLLGTAIQAAPQVIMMMVMMIMMIILVILSLLLLPFLQELFFITPCTQGQSDCAYVDEEVCNTIEVEVCEDGTEW